MSRSSQAFDRLDRAQGVLESFEERRAAGGVLALEDMIAEHPELEAELRELVSACGEVAQGFGEQAERGRQARLEVEQILSEVAAGGGFAGRYTIEGEVGQGGMGAVLRVRDRKLDRPLAMKVILGQAEAKRSGETPPVSPHQLKRFLNEARITSQLDHPGIVPVHEVGVDEEGRAYFTMKLVQGRTLAEVFELHAKKDPLWSTPRVLGVIQRVCEALAFAHERGVIHRDLKPANVMVGDFGEVYVMDWGLARRLDQAKEQAHERVEIDEELSPQVSLTREGRVLGTPCYMSPEQARGEIAQMGPQSDVYAIGAMLYQLIAGTPPYLKKDEKASESEILARVVTGRPQRIESRSTPPELIAICEKAMNYERADRYANVHELADDLQRFLGGRTVKALKTGAWVELKKWVQRNKPLAASLAAVVLALTAGFVVILALKGQADANAQLASENEQKAEASEARAVAGESEAKQQASFARTNEARALTSEVEARRQAEVATQKSNDVLSLSAIQELKELVERADLLWPAFPEKLAEYDRWLAEAKVLIEGSAADAARGIAARPSSRDHESKLAEIRQRAKPVMPEQLEQDRSASPSFAAWEKARAKLVWMRRMLGDEPWPSEAEVEAALSKEVLPANANGLNSLAWPLVDTDPTKVVYGSEIKALILARRAVAAAQDAERAGIRDTLGWALYRCGRWDEALAEEQRAVDEAQDKQREELAASLKKLQEEVALWTKDDARAKQADEASKLSARVADLERDVSERLTFGFEDTQDRWWHAQLSKLVADLKGFTDEQTGGLFSSGVSEQNGWGIMKRAEFARTIGQRSVDGPEASRLWSEAIAAIAASPKYGGMKQTPQLGLLPIGADPESGLWEFAHLQTGEPAQRGADGKLLVTEAMGLIFVLIPGGTFWMGAQKADANGRNYDPQALANESPVHEVTLSAYFLSKYEMTQGQWERFTGRNPSNFGPSMQQNGHQHDLTHPVEQVTWTQCMEVMSRLGLALPSEAQWECGSRGGTDTPWWTGAERESLRGNVNLADQTAAKGGAVWSDIKDWPDLEDGWVVHAPVGSLPANPFGLHEVHGNVWEWCRDGYGRYSAGKQLDPVIPWTGASNSVFRGGGFIIAASDARSAYRVSLAPEFRDFNLGLRPARAFPP